MVDDGRLQALCHSQSSLKVKLTAKIDRQERSSNRWKRLTPTKSKQLQPNRLTTGEITSENSRRDSKRLRSADSVDR